MNTRSTRSIRFARLLIAASGLAASLAQADITYRVTDLGPGSASSINNVGQVLGLRTGGGYYLYTPGPGIVFFRSLPDARGFSPQLGSSAINDAGLVAGVFFDGAGGHQPALYEPGIGVRPLGTLGGIDPHFATGVNNAGQVTGFSGTSSEPSTQHAFRWSHSTGMVDLGTLGGRRSFGHAINNAGVVTGHSSTSPPVGSRAFVQSGSEGMVNIASFLALGMQSSGYAINDSGQVTGTVGGRFLSAFLYTPGVGMRLLNTSPEERSTGYGLDSKGRVVGEKLVPGEPLGDGQAFIHSGHRFADLNTLLDPASGAGWDLHTALDINERGQIVGNGELNGVDHGFLLTPVPEPQTWALMLGGLVLVGAAARRRRLHAAAA